MRNLWKLTLLALFVFTTTSYATENFIGKIISPIPDNIKKLMIGHSWHHGCPVGLNELVYLQLPYWGFDDKPHMGEMIVHQIVANEVVDIFQKLYVAHFPIEQMILPEELLNNVKFDSDNSSAFFCEKDGQSPGKYSTHAFGLAIDINVLYNPAYDAGGRIYPKAGAKYLNRKLDAKGMIKVGDIVTTTFYEHGWTWGAYFNEGADYQHFQKMIGSKYVVNNVSHRDKNENPKIPSYY